MTSSRILRVCVLTLSLAVFGFGCAKQPPASAPKPNPQPPQASIVNFGTSATLRVGQSVAYADGLTVRLNAINDSRCKPGVQCIWAGELGPVLTVSGGSLPAAQEVNLGTMRTQQATVGAYEIVLRDASETEATIIVTKSTATAPVPDDLIRVTRPQPNETVRSPLVVTGEARGTWYFEASFPVRLLDANGELLAQAPAQAQGDWMTSEFVPFTVTLTFPNPVTRTGTLILLKDNPSGLPQNEDQRVIPVRFSP